MPSTASARRSDDASIAALATRVTERDRAICRTLYEHRVLTASQLAELYFDSPERARQRLIGLHRIGVLERFRPHRQHGSHPYHYLLDKLGAQLIAAERGLDIKDLDWTRAKALRLATNIQLEHLIGASGFFTRLTWALRQTTDCQLERWWGQRRCARAWGELVVPDGYARLALPTGTLETWLEWDRSTEPHARLRDKLDRYAELALALDRQLTLLFGAVASWLRLGELEATETECAPYDARRFRAAISEIRDRLTLKAPEHWEPELQRLCAGAGVAVVFVPEIKGTRASGAARWLTPNKALIQLSLRHKSDDHLWFSFFHEAAHILLHSKKQTFVSGDITDKTAELEADANRFAAQTLIPKRYEAELGSLCGKQDVLDFADRLGIAPGIVVGRLQNDGLLDWSKLNSLKQRLEFAD